jgi:hypothetical protein
VADELDPVQSGQVLEHLNVAALDDIEWVSKCRQLSES